LSTTAAAQLNAADLTMFARLGIPVELLAPAGIRRVTDTEAREIYGIRGDGNMDGIVFPYFDPSTRSRVTARLRRDTPEVVDGKLKRKYVCPYGDRRLLYFPPGAADLLADPNVPIVLVESEKAALALTAWASRRRRRILAVGLGGAWGWKAKTGKTSNANGNRVDEKGPTPGLQYASRGRKTFVLLDANAATNEEVRYARSKLVQQLNTQGADVVELDLPAIADVNGPDDFIGLCGDEAVARVFESPKREKFNFWLLAAGMDVFLGGEEEAVDFLFPPVIVKEAVTEIFSPRGLGKSLWALFVGVFLALAGCKVLLIDRDNPRHVVRERLRAFGATSNLATLKVLSRENAPPLTNARAWAEFPYMDYDFVIVDSLDSAAEGIGEQDSTKPSLAIAPLLDIAHREGGPAVLLLGNTIKTAAHSRGSGVIEDRADIVFEVRDATNFHPTGKKPWIEELPAADAGSWAGRSTRRKRLSQYRLAFIATKFRIGEEPEPFIVEIDLNPEPWTVRDVTDDVDREGKAERERQAQQRATALEGATESLMAEILRREADGEPVLLRKQAEEFLTSRGIKRKVAREALKSPAFETVEFTGKGHPKGVRLAGKNDNGGRNSTPTKPAPDAGSSYGDFSHPHPGPSAEIPPQEPRSSCCSQSMPISAEPALFTLPTSPETDANDEDEVVL